MDGLVSHMLTVMHGSSSIQNNFQPSAEFLAGGFLYAEYGKIFHTWRYLR